MKWKVFVINVRQQMHEMFNLFFSTVMYVQGVHEKLCFFTIHCNPSLAYITEKTFKALNAMRVYSHSYWLVNFCKTNSSRVLAKERLQTFENSWKKTQYLNNTLYISLNIFWSFVSCFYVMMLTNLIYTYFLRKQIFLRDAGVSLSPTLSLSFIQYLFRKRMTYL